MFLLTKIEMFYDKLLQIKEEKSSRRMILIEESKKNYKCTNSTFPSSKPRNSQRIIHFNALIIALQLKLSSLT
jgi:hypothetical protein